MLAFIRERGPTHPRLVDQHFAHGRAAHAWGWSYPFEAYTPAPQRKLGYYALPLLWRDRVVGWGNASLREGRLQVEIGYADDSVRRPGFRRALADEHTRLREFLGL